MDKHEPSAHRAPRAGRPLSAPQIEPTRRAVLENRLEELVFRMRHGVSLAPDAELQWRRPAQREARARLALIEWEAIRAVLDVDTPEAFRARRARLVDRLRRL